MPSFSLSGADQIKPRMEIYLKFVNLFCEVLGHHFRLMDDSHMTAFRDPEQDVSDEVLIGLYTWMSFGLTGIEVKLSPFSEEDEEAPPVWERSWVVEMHDLEDRHGNFYFGIQAVVDGQLQWRPIVETKMPNRDACLREGAGQLVMVLRGAIEELRPKINHQRQLAADGWI